jgi:hypothetical protein
MQEHINNWGLCDLCGDEGPTPYITPADPPFFPDVEGRHCEECEQWLRTGELPQRKELT